MLSVHCKVTQALSHNGTREATQHQALMQSAKDSVQHINVTQRLLQETQPILPRKPTPPQSLS